MPMKRKPNKRGASKSFLKALDKSFNPKLKAGDEVMHRLHGNGKIMAFSGDPYCAIVQFDHEIEAWGTDTLEVQISSLVKR